MLASIRSFFEQNLTSSPEQKQPFSSLQLAAAALLIETMEVDESVDDIERSSVINTLKTLYSLSTVQVEQLISLAKQEKADAADYHQFTSLVHKHFTAEEKSELLESLWRVAYADGRLDKYEEHYIRKIADLLYLSQETFITTKKRAMTAQ